MVVTEEIGSINFYALTGCVDNAIKLLQNIKTTYLGKDLRLELRRHEEGLRYDILWDRPMNHEEIAKEDRRKQYEILKKEFESQNCVFPPK